MHIELKEYKNILFDLDGTIIDPKEGITNSVKNALDYFGINVEDEKDLYKFIGPPLYETFPKYYNFNEEETILAVEKFREYFRVKGILENVLYDGIEELLKRLEESGKNIMLATSKGTIFAEQILKNYKIDKFFTFIGGSEFNGTRIKKAEVIQYVLEQNKISDLSTVVMIGDREHDIIGAKEIGIDSIGVLYGYGDYEELSKAGATYIVRDVAELNEKLL